MAKVSLTKCASYDQLQVDAAVKQSFDLLGGLANFVKPNQKVLIKPNILMGVAAHNGTTTHPAIVKAVIKLVKALGATPIVGDSPGFEPSKRAFERCGMLEVIKEEQAHFTDFSQGNDFTFKDGFVCKNLKLAKEVFECDVIINVAKLKTHGYTGITAAVKNLFGCIPGLFKSHFHVRYPNKDNFALMLLDLLRIIKPTLNIVDAVMAMDGEGGPTTGNLRNLGLLVFGTDAVAVDATCALLTGKQPQDFSFLRLAAENKVGEPDPTKIDIVGARLENSICHDFKHIEISREQMLPGWIPAFIVNYARKLLLDRPVLQRENCKKCGACSTICAAKAIKPVNGYPTFNYAKCIRCFCCQEMCKYKALKIKRSFLARILLRS